MTSEQTTTMTPLRSRWPLEIKLPPPPPPTPEQAELNRLTGAIMRAALTVHKRLGPGLLEGVYEACLAHELKKAGVGLERQVPIHVTYDELEFEEAYRLDLLVEGKIIVELKTAERIHPVHKAQLLTYMRLAKKRLGLLISFNTTLLKNGVTRLIL
jgi:GxxExxY protein